MAEQIIAENSLTRLQCSFSHPNSDPEKITLDLAPSGVTWNYVLNSNVIDTYGGQVVQILGVTVQNLEIKGNFGGIDPQWGVFKRDIDYVPNTPKFVGKSRWSGEGDEAWKWNNNPQITNGIRQMGEWFREYFVRATQGVGDYGKFASFDERVMWFDFPARNWHIPIRPTSFPKIRIANDEVAPEWIVQADFVESFESSREFLTDISSVALGRLNQLKDGIGFRKNNPLSEYTGDIVQLEDLSGKIIKNYQDSVLNGFSEEEINELISIGFSYPPGVYGRAGEDGAPPEEDDGG